ncbi:DUF4430 domain-containing protein [Paenibacillaceae bacterium]|nr:DUF4430 domain-containing protein [Paenibacillaceae bacterium]
MNNKKWLIALAIVSLLVIAFFWDGGLPGKSSKVAYDSAASEEISGLASGGAEDNQPGSAQSEQVDHAVQEQTDDAEENAGNTSKTDNAADHGTEPGETAADASGESVSPAVPGSSDNAGPGNEASGGNAAGQKQDAAAGQGEGPSKDQGQSRSGDESATGADLPDGGATAGPPQSTTRPEQSASAKPKPPNVDPNQPERSATGGAGTPASTDKSVDAGKPAKDKPTAANKPQDKDQGKEQPPVKPVAPDKQDKYLTDPVPDGKPQPVEWQDTKVDKKAKMTATLFVTAATILDNMDQFNEDKLEVLPKDGIIYKKRTVTFYEGESVFDLLLREMKSNKIHMEFSMTPIYNSNYVEGINNLYEFDCGELSGWMYKVNGWYPNYGSSRYSLQDGDVVEWVYTCDLGRDIGGDMAVTGGK